MAAAGIIVEYDPFHTGHLYQFTRIREMLGADTPIVCAMSGNFVQRGGFAVVRKHIRAQAAVCSGADLVLELPLLWAVSSAERFADGGVQTLESTGIVSDLVFGSECGDAEKLKEIAMTLCRPEFPSRLKEELSRGVSFAAARETALAGLIDADTARLVEQPNNILGVEYCKALIRRKSRMTPVTVRRKGPGHGAADVGEMASASAIRTLLAAGERKKAFSLMPSAMCELYAGEEQAGRAPVLAENCERAILARLRMMTAEDFLNLDAGGEGLGNRFYSAARNDADVGEILANVKTKRYARSRIQRMLLQAYLGLKPEEFPEQVPYLRVLAANAVGCGLLAQMREKASLPVLTKPADVRVLTDEARRVFALEARATDLYTLAYPNLKYAQGGAEWRTGPVIL